MKNISDERIKNLTDAAGCVIILFDEEKALKLLKV